jgi:hypothetical protein
LQLTAEYIFTGTDYLSVWRRPLSEIITGVDNKSLQDVQSTLYQNFPNPFTTSTQIKFQVKNGGNIRLTVSDIFGREAAILADEYLTPGTYEITFNASALTPGIYYYSIQTGNLAETKKMILLK